MGGFLKSIAQMGLTGAATAAGGPLAGAATAGGLGFLNKAMSGGNLGESLMGAGTGAGSAYLGGQLANAASPAINPNTIGGVNYIGAAPLMSTGGESPLLKALQRNPYGNIG